MSSPSNPPASDADRVGSAASVDFARRFGGVARLYGAAALDRFRHAHVAVIGLGGVGSWTAEALARSAVGRLTLIDLDNVAESNTNRQLHALEGNYGMAKVDAMRARILAINPFCKVQVIEDFVEVDTIDAMLGQGFDDIVDAIDDSKVKVALLAWATRRRQPVLTLGGAGGQIDPTRVKIDDLARTVQDPLLAKVRSRLRREHGFPKGPGSRMGIRAVYSDEALRAPLGEGECAIDGAAGGLNCAGFGSSVCVTATFGLAAAAEVLKRLAARTSLTR